MLTKNSIKQFLKPDRRKVILIIVFFFLATGISGVYNKEVDNNSLYGPLGFFIMNSVIFKEYGFPLKWLKVGAGEKITSYSSLAVDLIFWYLISCLLIFIYDKIKAKKPVV